MRYILCGINAKYIHSNLAIFSLKTYGEQTAECGGDIRIKEYTINHYVEQILQDLYEEKADVIIFSCYIWNIHYVKELAKELKKVSPETRIWVGGPEVSYDAEIFLQENPAVDLVMLGEGEKTFSELVRQMEQGESLESRFIPGIAYRSLECETAARNSDDGEFKIVNTGFPMLLSMDELPFVYTDFELFHNKILYYESSRGCPFRCSYCLSSVDKTVRLRSLNLVFSELQSFLDAKVPQVKFVDRTFNCNKSHARAIWKYILTHDNGITNFHFEISSDILEEEDFALFEQMRPGLIQLEIGVQSTNPATIDAIHRRMDLPLLWDNVDRVHNMGNIHQHLDLIIGLPYEDYERFGISFNDMYQHQPDQLQVGFLKVLKGTVMEEEADQYGILYRDSSPYEVLQTRWLDYDDVIRLKAIEELVELYYNSFQFTYTLRYAVPHYESPFQFFETFASYYRKRDYHKMSHNRMKKYEILRDFLLESKGLAELPYLNDVLIYDMYLRENGKSRPSWASDQSAYRKAWKDIYRNHSGELFPDTDIDSRQAANKSHIERFAWDIDTYAKTGGIVPKETFLLFDYTKRNPLNYEARTVKLLECYMEKG